jgi:hypothetical protein
MSTFDRTTIIRGPAKITYDSQVFYSKGAVTLTFTNSSFEKTADAYGLVGRGKTDFQAVVEFEPAGEIEALTVLFPYASTAMGADIYGSTDKPLVITAVDSTWTIKNAAVTQMPSIRCTAQNTAFGSVQFTGLLDKTGGDPAAEASYFTRGAGAAINGANFNPALILAGNYGMVLDSIGNAFSSEAGFDISFETAFSPKFVDGFGTVGMSLTNVGGSISCIPVGVAQDEFDYLLSGFAIGGDLVSDAVIIQDTEDTLGTLVFECQAQLADAQSRFSASESRVGALNLNLIRTFTSAGPNPLFAISAAEA